MHYHKIVENIREKLESYIKENNLTSLVIGLSGGIDSTVCAALAMPVCKKIGIPLVGRSIPIESNKKDEIKRAKRTGKIFCDHFTEDNMDRLYYEIVGSWPLTLVKDPVRRGNIKARLRMIELYDSAANFGGMVLSTDNYTEYLLGFWTLHGDVGDYGMIQGLWKSEVYDLADYLMLSGGMSSKYADILRECSQAIATDGLGVTSSDLEQIYPGWEGSSREGYNEVDDILQRYIDLMENEAYIDEGWRKTIIELEKHPVIKRFKATEFKRDNPHNICRQDLLK